MRATEAPGCAQAEITLCSIASVKRLRSAAGLTTLIWLILGVRFKRGGHYRIGSTSGQDVMVGRLSGLKAFFFEFTSTKLDFFCRLVDSTEYE